MAFSQSSFSPKSSPRTPRQDSSGTLKTTISLGRTPAIVHSGPFYLMKDLPESSELTGATNLINHHRLGNTYAKLVGRKTKEGLSAFLPNLPGNIDVPATPDDGSSLYSLLETRIITPKEILPLTATQLIGFRLHPGPLPPQYRTIATQFVHTKHKKHKKKQRTADTPTHEFGSSEGQDQQVSERKKKERKKEKRKDKKKDKKRKNLV